MGPRVALLLGLLVLSPRAAATDWVRVETPNLIVFGPGERRTREVTAEFERFREAIGHVLPGAAIASPVPTIVVVFENDAAFNPYRPLFNGKPIKLGGFYTGTESDNMIAFPVGDRDDGLRIIFHEYSHLITANAIRGLSPWVGEGLAEFYSTFEIRPDGKQALLGRPVPGHIELLNSTSKWLTLDELHVTHDSPLYNEGERRSLFYAQSWALVHMFLTGEQNRSKQLSQYVDLTVGGMAQLDAWRRAFGDFDMQKELRRYVTQHTVGGFLYRFPAGIGTLKAEAMKPKPTDVDAVLSRLLRYRDDEEVEPRLLRAAKAAPESLLARALLGHRYVQSGKDEVGIRLLVAAAADSDWLTQYYAASGIAWHADNPSTEAQGVALRAADRVIAARPQLAHGYALKSRLVEGAEAVANASQARKLAPGREDYTFLEAQLRADLGDYAAARSTLAPLLTPIYPPAVRDRARSLMGQIVRMEEFHARRGPPPATGRDRGDGGSSSGSCTTGDTGTAPSPAGMQWVFREMKPGEQRTEGTLERIDCARTGAVTLVIRSGHEVRRFAAPQFSDVDFITYRELQGGSIACGERKTPESVYLTWLPLAKPSAGVAGRPVAVEFLPEKR